jgi:hypothetical protein
VEAAAEFQQTQKLFSFNIAHLLKWPTDQTAQLSLEQIHSPQRRGRSDFSTLS